MRWLSHQAVQLHLSLNLIINTYLECSRDLQVTVLIAENSASTIRRDLKVTPTKSGLSLSDIFLVISGSRYFPAAVFI